MRALSLAVLAALLVPVLAAQTVPPRGADDTFEVATWNLEFFGAAGQGPSNDTVQLNNVGAVIEQSEIDLWALQEVVDVAEWSNLLTRLQSAGYSGRLGPQVSTNPTFDQKLAFIYDRSVVQVTGSRTILSDFDYEFAGRLPFEMQARVTVEGVARTVYVITFHAKASTGSEDYARRQAAAVALKDYIGGRIGAGDEVILLGDFNDYLTGSTRGSSFTSPYDGFVQDADYVPVTLALEDSGVNTFCTNSTCSGGDTRDHLLFTSGLSGLYVEGSVDRYGEVLTGVSSYVNSTSDHVPVLARFSFLSTDTSTDPDAGVALLAPAPNPVRADARLSFRLDAPGEVQLDVFDALGRRVALLAGTYGAGPHSVQLGSGAFAPGVYVVRLQAAGVVRTQRLIRAE